MACELTKGRALDCKDIVGGIRAVYFVQLDDVTLTSASGSVSDIDIAGSGSGDELYKYSLVRGTGSFTETITASAENGTVFYEPSTGRILADSIPEPLKEEYKDFVVEKQ